MEIQLPCGPNHPQWLLASWERVLLTIHFAILSSVQIRGLHQSKTATYQSHELYCKRKPILQLKFLWDLERRTTVQSQQRLHVISPNRMLPSWFHPKHQCVLPQRWQDPIWAKKRTTRPQMNHGVCTDSFVTCFWGVW